MTLLTDIFQNISKTLKKLNGHITRLDKKYRKLKETFYALYTVLKKLSCQALLLVIYLGTVR